MLCPTSLCAGSTELTCQELLNDTASQGALAAEMYVDKKGKSHNLRKVSNEAPITMNLFSDH